MRQGHHAFLLSCILSLAICAAQERDWETGMASWPRMKRDAGYYTESGIWRGGLWRLASNTEEERYECQRGNGMYCTEWTTYEENRKKREVGVCVCVPTASPFCWQWNCASDHYDKNAAGNPYNRRDRLLLDTLDCNCTVESKNGRYCHAWSCVDASSTGYSEEEDYECLVEDMSQEYCYRWRGNISSSFEIESSVCECVERGKRFCKAWECRERALIRCAAHDGGWCSLGIAVGVAAGVAAVYFLAFLAIFIYWDAVERWINVTGSNCMYGCCFFSGCIPFSIVFLTFFLLTASAHPDTPLLVTIIGVPLGFLILYGPLSMGILLWGGYYAFLYVIPLWLFPVGMYVCIIVRAKIKKRKQESTSQV